MVFTVLAALFSVATWLWGDWRNWRQYQSTSLYFLLGNSMYDWFTVKYPLWQHQPTRLILSYTVTELVCMICFAVTPLIYLGRFPTGRGKAIVWVVAWIGLFSAIEGFLNYINAITYFHGWNPLHSILFDCIMFPMLFLHFKRPLLAYMISIPIAISLVHLNHVPIQ